MGIKNFPVRAGPCPSLHCPPSPILEKYIFFALPSMNGPLPAELKFRENTAHVRNIQSVCAVTIFLFSRIAVRGNWVRFLYNPIHVLCMQQFHSIFPQIVNMSRVETSMDNKRMGLSRRCLEKILWEPFGLLK